MQKEAIARHYLPRMREFSRGFEILDWESEAAQEGRFSVLVEHADLEGRSLLDVGCGVGDLLAYLTKRGVALDYTGIDLLPEMAAEASRRNGGRGRFLSGDLFSDTAALNGRYDVVFASGIFNLNLGNNREFLAAALPVLFSFSSDLVVFNLLDTDHPVQSERYMRYCPEEAAALAEQHARSVELIQGYIPYDTTLICRVRRRACPAGG